MDAGSASPRVVADRLAWIDRMLAEIRRLPLASRAEFMADSRNASAAESCLRRALEATFDLGRHLLAKGSGEGSVEYKEVATRLAAAGVLTPDESELLRRRAGYGNRMVRFYHEISPDELYEICRYHLGDVETIANAFRRWVQRHPEATDSAL